MPNVQHSLTFKQFLLLYVAIVAIMILTCIREGGGGATHRFEPWTVHDFLIFPRRLVEHCVCLAINCDRLLPVPYLVAVHIQCLLLSYAT